MWLLKYPKKNYISWNYNILLLVHDTGIFFNAKEGIYILQYKCSSCKQQQHKQNSSYQSIKKNNKATGTCAENPGSKQLKLDFGLAIGINIPRTYINRDVTCAIGRGLQFDNIEHTGFPRKCNCWCEIQSST